MHPTDSPLDSVDPAVFERQPLFDWTAELDAVRLHEGWPAITRLEALRESAQRFDAVDRPRFARQSPELLADGLHYEQRIRAGTLATRERNWHDLLNGLVWIRYPRIKWALNSAQCLDIGVVGPRLRTRRQCAMTHFDEAGAIVLCSDPELVARWDLHDWPGLFWEQRQAWGTHIAAHLFGHAVLELALQADRLLVAKCIVLQATPEQIAGTTDRTAARHAVIDARIAELISAGHCLLDPQELRPLPLSGIPGWTDASMRESFYADAPCFRPLREGRRYPPPVPA